VLAVTKDKKMRVALARCQNKKDARCTGLAQMMMIAFIITLGEIM